MGRQEGQDLQGARAAGILRFRGTLVAAVDHSRRWRRGVVRIRFSHRTRGQTRFSADAFGEWICKTRSRDLSSWEGKLKRAATLVSGSLPAVSEKGRRFWSAKAMAKRRGQAQLVTYVQRTAAGQNPRMPQQGYFQQGFPSHFNSRS